MHPGRDFAFPPLLLQPDQTFGCLGQMELLVAVIKDSAKILQDRLTLQNNTFFKRENSFQSQPRAHAIGVSLRLLPHVRLQRHSLVQLE